MSLDLVNVPGAARLMAGFQVSINGRFWVSTEGKAQTLERNSLEATREGLRRLTEEHRRRAAENEKAGREGLAIGENAKEGKKIRAALDLVNHHEALEGTQGRVGFAQPAKTRGVLEVEVVDRGHGHELSGECRLSALPRAEQGDDATPPQGGPDPGKVFRALNHGNQCTMNILYKEADIHGLGRSPLLP